ncbi:MAG TPA: extracellular solute-binding protein, partial [Patescibacteria group bacterium]
MSDSLPKPTSPNQSTGKTISPASQLPVTSPKETVIKPTATAQPAGVNPALAPKPVAPPLVSKNTPPSLAGSSQPSVLAGAGKPPTQPPSQSSTQPPSPPSGQPPSQLAGQPPVKQPLMAGIKANPRKWIMVVLAVLFGVGLIVFLISRIFAGRSGSAQPSSQTPSPVQQTVIAYWGLWEPTAALEGIISDYETANPGIQIDYRVQSHKDYRERLQTAIASGNGPDIFRYHASWVPMLTADLAVLPANIMSAQEFQNTFYPSAAEQLQVEGRIVGLPLMYDGLVLYYNTQILQTAGVEPPNSWSDLKQLAGELTVPADKSERRRSGIQRSGLAIGNASNIDHFSDILALLILQNGGDPLVPAF